MALKDVLDEYNRRRAEKSSGASGIDIPDAVWAYVAREANVPDEWRAVGYHPSQLYKLCPRLEVLRRFFPKPQTEWVATADQMNWDWGSAWHLWVQNRYFGPMGMLFGAWRCNTCAILVGDCFMPEPCKKCWPDYTPPDKDDPAFRRGGYWNYVEPEVKSDEWGVVGHADGILILDRTPSGRKSLLEVKTIEASRFKHLYSVDEPYIFQVQLYLWLTGLPECWITYWTKDAVQTKPKVFRISYDETVATEAKRRITLDRAAKADGRLCDGICSDPSDKFASKCSHRQECFRPDIAEVIERLRAGIMPGQRTA